MATKSALAAWMNQHTVNPLLLASVEAVGLAEHTAALQREGVALVVVMRRRRRSPPPEARPASRP